MRRVAGASIAVLVVLGWSASASGGSEAIASVSESDPRVSLGADERPLVIWRRFEDGHSHIQSAVLDDAGAPGPVVNADLVGGQFVKGSSGHRAFIAHSTEEIGIVRLDDTGAIEHSERISHAGLSDVKAAFGDDGRMTITWEVAPGAGDSAVYAVRTDAHGNAGPIREVFPDRATSDWRLRVDSQGRTIVARLVNGKVDFVKLDPDGVPGPVTQVRDYPAESFGFGIDPQDRPTFGWTESVNPDMNAVRIRRVESDGTLGPIRTVYEGSGVGGGEVKFDATGGGTALLRMGGGNIAASRIAPDGTPGPVVPVGPPAYDVNWDVDDLGRTRIAWEKEGRIETTRLDPDGTPGAIRTITDLGDRYFSLGPPTNLDMAVDPQGRATIAWGRWPAGYGGGWGPIEAVRIAADGTIGQVHQVSPGGQTVPEPGDRTRPELTLEGSTQRLRSVVALDASCDEICRMSAYGSVSILRKRGGQWMGVGRSIPLGDTIIGSDLCRRSSDVRQCSHDLRLKLEAPGRHRAKRALRRGRRVVAHITVEAEDAARNWTWETERIRLKLRKPKNR